MAGVIQDQELQGVLTSVALMNMDGEGLDDVQKWIRRKLVGQGVVTPTDEEKLEMQQEQQSAPPDPTAELVAAKVQDLQASAAEKKSGAILKVAQAHALGGPAEAPAVPDGLEAVHKAVQIRKDLATATNLETKTAHMPLELSIEAKNAETNRVKAHKQSRPAQ
jgi:hypothetical protein